MKCCHIHAEPYQVLLMACPVVQIRRAETSQVANYMLDRLGQGQVTAELLQPDELVSGMMAQIAADPDLAQLLTTFIYSSEGITHSLPTDPLTSHESSSKPSHYWLM